MPTIENADNTLTTIKRNLVDIRTGRKTITPEMVTFLSQMATRCYEVKGTRDPQSCGASYVRGMISHLHIKIK